MSRVLLVALVGLAACAPVARPFPRQAPVWRDLDDRPVAKRPAKYESGLAADGADKILFRRLSEPFALRTPGEAVNVNSLDEVPSGAWFENRIGLTRMTPQEVRRGACGPDDVPDPDRGPWRVTAAKPNGANPGFEITTPDGARYLLKFDGAGQPRRATAADVIGSKLYHAAGYHTPCNEIVRFHREVLVIDPKATRKDAYGDDVPMTSADLETVLAASVRHKDGSLRASASRYLAGVPLGPFRYEGTRDDDPNDRIAHQDRRELRGARLFAAWLNHFDSREQNSLDLWVTERGRSFVRHYKIDWGDSLGSFWPWDPLNRRIGFSGYLDFDHVATDLVTLGLVRRPWHRAQSRSDDATFGYFGAQHFVPSQWRGGYPNPAFDRMTLRDALWASRSLARIGDDHLRAAIAAARLDGDGADERLFHILAARRDRILSEYFGQGASLSRFLLVRRTPPRLDQSLCFEDDALRTGVAEASSTTYRVRALGGARLDETLGWHTFTPDPQHPTRSCVLLPVGHHRPSDRVGADAPDDDPRRYTVVEIASTQEPVRGCAAVTAVHLYDLGPERGFELVGLERMPCARRST